MLGENELPIHLDVENAPTACDELGRDVVVLLNLGRQTGCPWFVVSTRAIGNSDDHSFLPSCIIVEVRPWDRALEALGALEA
jgi:hypothetical protein